MSVIRYAGALAPGAVCLALAATSSAQAQALPAAVDSVIVTASPDPEDPPVVAAARARLSETPGAVSVIAQEAFVSRQAVALDDMLRDAPGVYAQRKWGGDIRISIRGSGLGNANHNRGLLIAQDGVPLNEADGYGDSQIADPLLTRFIEVYRGGNALRFGGALLGGAINMVTPTGRNAGFNAQARIDGGAFDMFRQNLQVAGTSGDWDGFAAITRQQAQGWRPQNKQDIQFYSLNLGRSFGENREIRLIVNASDIRQQIPGALTAAQFEADPRQAAPGNLANNYSRDQTGVRGSLRATWALDDTLTFEGAAYAVYKDLNHPIFQVINQESSNFGGFGRLQWRGELGGMRADGYAGLWLRRGELDSNFYVNLRGASGDRRSTSFQDATGTDVFAEGRLFVTDRLALIGGGTWGRATRDYRSIRVPGVATTFDLAARTDYDWLAPRIGLLWESGDGAQTFANLTRSVEPPNFGALSPTGAGLAPVVPQEAWTAEVGTRGRRGPLTWDITAYRARLDNELLQYTVSPAIPATTFNAHRTIHQGLEAALDWRLATGLRLRQTYTWSDFRFKGDVQYGDNRLPIAPQHFYRAELRYDDVQGWFVAPSVEWSASDIWLDYANTARSPSYAVLNLNAGWRLNRTVSVYVDARNLFDKAYVSNVQAAIRYAPTAALYWPGDGRAVYGGLTLTF